MTKLLVALAAAGVVALAGVGNAASQASKPDEVLKQARRLSLSLRTGQYGLAAEEISLLEAAVADHPQDGRLWNALGTAYYEQITADFNAGAFRDIPAHLAKAQAAHEKALAIEPNDPVAISGHGAALAIGAGIMRRPDLGKQGIAELNRAAELGPGKMVVRLQRGFTNLGVNADLRDRAATEADLKVLLAISEGSRAGDVLHVLLGDFYAEGGQADLARPHYVRAAREDSKVRDLGAARLAALPGGPPAAEVARLRGQIPCDCAMCHGS